MRGKPVTAFCAAISWLHLMHGRTDLIPLAYSLSGEKQVDELVGKYMRGMLQGVMTASFSIPGYQVEPAAGSISGSHPPPSAPRVSLTVWEEI